MFDGFARVATLFVLSLVFLLLCAAAVFAQGAPAGTADGVTLDLALMQRLAALLSFLISVVAMVYAFFATRRKDIDRRFHEGSKRMDRHDLRLQALEQDVMAMPGKDDLHRVELSLGEIAGDMKAMAATLVAMGQSVQRTEKIVGRHEDHLREGK